MAHFVFSARHISSIGTEKDDQAFDTVIQTLKSSFLADSFKETCKKYQLQNHEQNVAAFLELIQSKDNQITSRDDLLFMSAQNDGILVSLKETEYI